MRTIREYQFLPEQPSSRTDHSERASPASHHYGVPLDASSVVIRASSVSGGHRDDYKSPPQMIPNLNLSAHQVKPGHVSSHHLGEYDSTYQKSYVDPALHGNEDPFVKSERELGNHNDEDEDDDDDGDDVLLQLERKRKVREFFCVLCLTARYFYPNLLFILQSEEARISREVEAHEKRIRKELERQDMLRRKVFFHLS